ncbi:unnamed protein product [Peniophora sp. CBMAI 1063]|nr:unnamed protein product [Peniophora sp. CBMAI 1063]
MSTSSALPSLPTGLQQGLPIASTPPIDPRTNPFWQVLPPGGYYQGPFPLATSLPQPQLRLDYDARAFPILSLPPHSTQYLLGQNGQNGNAMAPPVTPHHLQPQPHPSQPQYIQPQAPDGAFPQFSMPHAPLNAPFWPACDARLLQQWSQPPAHAQGLQGLDLNNPVVIDTLLAMTRQPERSIALHQMLAYQACQPHMPVGLQPTSDPRLSHPLPPSTVVGNDVLSTSTQPGHEDQDGQPMAGDDNLAVVGTSGQSERKRKGEELTPEEDVPPVEPCITAKKPKISKLKGPSVRARHTIQHDMSSSLDVCDANEKPVVKRAKGNIFAKMNGTPLSVYVFDRLFNGIIRRSILNMVKVRSSSSDMIQGLTPRLQTHGGRLVGVGDIKKADFCVMDRGNSKEYRKVYKLVVDAKTPMVNVDFVSSCVKAGQLLRFADYTPFRNSVHVVKTRRSTRLSASVNEGPSRKSEETDIFGEEDSGSDSGSPVVSSDEEPEPSKRVVPSRRRSDKTPATSKDTPAPVALSVQRRSPEPPQKTEVGVRYKFTEEEMVWAWHKIGRMARKDAYLNLARASEGLAEKVGCFMIEGGERRLTENHQAPHHSAASWRSRLEREHVRFEELMTDTYPPKIAYPRSLMREINRSSRNAGQPATTITGPGETQVNESVPALQPREEEDCQKVVSFLMTYEPPTELEFAGDQFIWPVLNRELEVSA